MTHSSTDALIMGYVGTSVVFSLAIAALLSGKLGAAWARWSRALDYYCMVFFNHRYRSWQWLGVLPNLAGEDGGFSDPVEICFLYAFRLLGTALIHSLAVTEKRGGFKMWAAITGDPNFFYVFLGRHFPRAFRGHYLGTCLFGIRSERRGIFILIFLLAAGWWFSYPFFQ
jgi:cytochrome c-type biogenesis protein CcmF